MSQETSLELDLDRVGTGSQTQDIARVFVSHARAFTRHTGAPTLTDDCTSFAAFEREVVRLRSELDAALEAARAHFEGRKATAAPQTPEREAEAAPPPARIDLGLSVEDVMTRDVKTVGPNDQLSLVDELMKVGHFRHVVVREEDGHLAGVISQRDIFFGALAWSMGQGARAHSHVLESTPAQDVMRSEPITIDPDAPLTEAAELMTRHKIGCLPVLRGGELVGILTEGDFLALLSRPA
jgi:CBS domain-containing membrane protein